MKKRELFLDRIQIDDTYSIQVDSDTEEFVNIYKNDVIVEQFSLKRRIYTFFKVLQTYTNSDEAIIDPNKNIKLYGKEIHIKDQIYMQAIDEHKDLVIEFYKKEEDTEDNLLYLTKMNYMTQKLFNMMFIPKKVIDIPNYQIMNPKEFKDLMDILSVIKF
ncbi:hypothetical protein KHQ81_09145 [Mycoplasmatota bacterium]|nr:hypothetical protein KHQ81_09145 [Mycoplasmatota bacterium]